MKRKIVYTDEPMEFEVIPDFLPPPDQLVFKEDPGVKVTLTLSTRSVEFFKAEAARHKTQYQRMIRRLLDKYAAAHQRKGRKPARNARR